MIVPFEQLSHEALSAVIEEFVTRDGTEFTDIEVKSHAALRSLENGELVLVYDSDTESCNILSADRVEIEDSSLPGGVDGR